MWLEGGNVSDHIERIVAIWTCGRKRGQELHLINGRCRVTKETSCLPLGSTTSDSCRLSLKTSSVVCSSTQLILLLR